MASPAATPARLEHRVPVTTFNRAIFVRLHDRRFDSRQRLAHGTGPDRHREIIGDHDPAGLGLPPVVMDRQTERFLAPHDRFRIERLADAGDEAQAAEIVAYE